MTPYALAYRDAYARHLAYRRRTASIVGGAVGVTTGLGFLFWALSQGS